MTPPARLIDKLTSPTPRTEWLAKAAEQVRQYREQDRRDGVEWGDSK